MFAWLVFGAMALLVSAPLAVAFGHRPAALHDERWAILAFWSAYVALAAVIAGLVARSSFAGQALHAVEIAAMLGAGASICAGLLSAAGWRSARIPAIVAAAVVLLYLLLRASGAGGQTAAAIAWMLATATGLTVATASVAPRLWLAARPIMLGFAFVPVHAAQLVQIAAQGRLRAAVPAVSLVAMAAIATLIADRISRRRSPVYARSGLDLTSAQELFHAIEQLMAERKPYLRYALRREDLARELGVTPRAVGEAINRCTGVGFAAYLRGLRAAEAERLFLDPANHGVSLEALGMQAGFKSRSAFYAAFLDMFGVPPGERRARAAATVSARSGRDIRALD